MLTAREALMLLNSSGIMLKSPDAKSVIAKVVSAMENDRISCRINNCISSETTKLLQNLELRVTRTADAYDGTYYTRISW